MTVNVALIRVMTVRVSLNINHTPALGNLYSWRTTYSDVIILVSHINFGKIERPQEAKMAIFDDPTLI